jgi:hypothetical protein
MIDEKKYVIRSGVVPLCGSSANFRTSTSTSVDRTLGRGMFRADSWMPGMVDLETEAVRL